MLSLTKLRKNKAAVEDLLTASGSGQSQNGLDYISLMWDGGEVIARDKIYNDTARPINKVVASLNNFNIDDITQSFIRFSGGLKEAGNARLLHFQSEFMYITIYVRKRNAVYYVLNGLTLDITHFKLGTVTTILEGLADTLENTYPE